MLRRALSLVLIALVAGCGEKPEEKKSAGPPPTLITTVSATRAAFDQIEETIGTLEALQDPKLGAEIAGRVEKVLVKAGDRVARGQVLASLDNRDAKIQAQADSAELARQEALLAQQERLVARQQQLVQKGFISPNASEDSLAQRAALAQQVAAARARLEASQRAQTKAQVSAPFDGVIDAQMVSPGDFVKVGDALFQLVSNRTLRAHLPFPESAATRIKAGQVVRLTSPLAPGREFAGRISETRPMVSEGARALDVLVEVDNQDGSLRAGASVNATIVVAAKPDALTVPEQSVVLRPAGKVVYVIDAGRAKQRVVDAGSKRGGRIEILSGLNAGETIALDGAGFLTDGATVQVKAPPAKAPPAKAAATSASR